MREQAVTLRPNVRVWQDERLGQLWRVAYQDGDMEQVISFPDAQALGDFLAEQFGLNLNETFDHFLIHAA
ncbi:MAG: hypothetical protein HC822_28330 [Oscillochloris sp.]|nr:hypothetical protein [Oscillochloris sp.]